MQALLDAIRWVSLGLAIGLLLPMQAVAEAGWTQPGLVVELTPTRHKHFSFRLDIEDNPSGCRQPDRFYMDYAAAGAEFVYYTLLQASLQGKPIRAYVTGRCELKGYAEIASVTLLR